MSFELQKLTFLPHVRKINNLFQLSFFVLMLVFPQIDNTAYQLDNWSSE